ncbi:MAG: hypothetical protein ABJE10_12405 [bacterium]
MSVTAAFQPPTLDFTTASIGLVQITHAPADAQIVAQIIGGQAYFKVDSIVVYDVVTQIVDPGELPPGHKGPPPKQKVYVLAGQSDGATPLSVSVGQFIEVRVSTLPLSGPEPLDFVLGMLRILGSGWDPINVPLSSFAGLVSTTFLTAAPLYATIAQGDATDVPITVTNVRGSATDVSYEMSSQPGLAIASAPTHVQSGGNVHSLIRFAADATAPLGDHVFDLYESAFQGKQRDTISGSGFTLHVSPAPVVHAQRISILRYQWQTPDANADVGLPAWGDWAFQEIFLAQNGWSIRDFWKRCTFGLVVPEFTLTPWRTLRLTESGQQNDRQLMIDLLKSQAKIDGVPPTSYDTAVAFIHPPPCGAGAAGAGNVPQDVLFDQWGSVSFYQHEIGHALGFQHAWGPITGTTYGAYYDPYCVMGFSLTQSHQIPMPPVFAASRLKPDFWNSERRLSAAALYRYVKTFTTPTTIRRVAQGSTASVVLTGLAYASLDDPILAVVSTIHGEITVEYRPAFGDDVGVTPAIVVHSIDRRSVTPGATEVIPVFYEGKIDTSASGQFKTREGDVTISFDITSKVGRTVTVAIQA